MEHMCAEIVVWRRDIGEITAWVEVWAYDSKAAAKESKRAAKAMGYKFRYVTNLLNWDEGGKEMFYDVRN